MFGYLLESAMEWKEMDHSEAEWIGMQYCQHLVGDECFIYVKTGIFAMIFVLQIVFFMSDCIR